MSRYQPTLANQKTLEEVEEDLNGFFPNMLPDLSAFFMDEGIDDFHKENDKYGEDVISHLHSILKRCMLKNGDWDTEYFCEICRSIFSLIGKIHLFIIVEKYVRNMLNYIVFTGDFIKEYAYNPEADVSKLVRAIIDKLENPQEFNVLHLEDKLLLGLEVYELLPEWVMSCRGRTWGSGN
ncbi:hypothetical protein CFP56_036967 [Quercus suber]|uniref:Uncharacterized protein n=1 Tax=Quercus suber TaxID=58331 RepID=A0AAW0J607_QUESU